MKNSGLRVKRKKLQYHLKQKEESGEVRHEVDFEQLKIENKQFAEKFEARNQELLQLKLKSGNAMQVLNSYKVCWREDPLFPCASIRPSSCCFSVSLFVCVQKKLQSLTAESKRLDADMHSRQELMGRIETETSLVAKVRRLFPSLNLTLLLCIFIPLPAACQERDKAEALNRHLRQKLEDFKVPEVCMYVRSYACSYTVVSVMSE